jgi:hypothetical protein
MPEMAIESARPATGAPPAGGPVTPRPQSIRGTVTIQGTTTIQGTITIQPTPRIEPPPVTNFCVFDCLFNHGPDKLLLLANGNLKAENVSGTGPVVARVTLSMWTPISSKDGSRCLQGEWSLFDQSEYEFWYFDGTTLKSVTTSVPTSFTPPSCKPDGTSTAGKLEVMFHPVFQQQPISASSTFYLRVWCRGVNPDLRSAWPCEMPFLKLSGNLNWVAASTSFSIDANSLKGDHGLYFPTCASTDCENPTIPKSCPKRPCHCSSQ